MDFGLTQYIASRLPEMVYAMPYIGDVDFAPFAVALIIFAVLTVLFKVVLVVVIARLKALSQKTHTDIDDVVIAAADGISPWVYSYVAFFIALQPFTLPALLDMGLTAVFLFAVVWQLIEMALCFVEYFAMRVIEKDEDGDGQIDPNTATASHMVTLLARIVLWVLGGLFVLSNLGIEVTSLIAGLGIGGIAIAFALQGILSDLFSSFSLYFDKPFRIGDYVMIGTDAGVVERIGIKTTRIRTLQGEELVVSNSELTTARVQNFKKMEERRGSFQFGITYETPHDKVKAVKGMVERIFESVEGARLDRVHFTTFGDSALLFDVVFYVSSPKYAEYLDILEKVNFDLMDKFAEVGIEFAYPTQMHYVKNA
ncbi:MAG: mechanosensitive ion channel family protein [Candidatus Pacebacteria bacterium]|nr:mechanosensitive ion channel family protein [Candidatus Paceibacterota bacterium]